MYVSLVTTLIVSSISFLPYEVWVILQYLFFFGTELTRWQPVILGHQNIRFDGFIITLCSSNITCDNYFVTFDSSLFFLTFDGSFFILCSSSITCDSTLVTFSGSFFFSSHLTVSSSYYVLPTSQVTVLLLHSVVPLFFSQIW